MAAEKPQHPLTQSETRSKSGDATPYFLPWGKVALRRPDAPDRTCGHARLSASHHSAGKPAAADVFLSADDRLAKVAPLLSMMKDWRRFLRQTAPDDLQSRLQRRVAQVLLDLGSRFRLFGTCPGAGDLFHREPRFKKNLGHLGKTSIETGQDAMTMMYTTLGP
jgi:hypothetical protein